VTPLVDIDLVLASTSRYRRVLLERVTSRIRQIAPDADETSRPSELPAALSLRLAEAKARAVSAQCNNALVIGSDQVADVDGRILGKPGNAENARAQLAACSGKTVVFNTAICLIDTRVKPAHARTVLDTTTVRFRKLDASEIARYVDREQPFDCAGSFKCEGLGITLFESIESLDPTALIGLPLIALCKLLREADVSPL
jgi:7-methyl-GTP pyrophosphatase